MAARKPLGITGILVLTTLLLLSGHMLLRAYMPNVAFGLGGFILIVAILSYVLFLRHDVFGFIIIIYLLSHFSYADFQGGLWNLMAFGLLAVHLAIKGRASDFRSRDMVMLVLLFLFFALNLVGWVFNNPVPITPKMLGVGALLGYLFVFRQAASLALTGDRVRILVAVSCVMICFELLVALNQNFIIAPLNTPILGGYSDTGTTIDKYISDNSGTLTNFELLSEYALLVFTLLIPFLSSSRTREDMRFPVIWLIVSLVACLLIPILTSTRSAVILMVFVVLAYYLVLPMRLFSAIDRFSRQAVIIAVAALVIPAVGVYVGMENLEQDFSRLKGTHFTLENIASGKAINRGGLADLAMQRMEGESWWAGFGFGVPRSNRWAWFGYDPLGRPAGLSDYHSIYLSMPMIYGWVGTIIFMLIILLTWLRVMGTTLRYRNRKNYLLVLGVGFSLFWFVFLVDEFKISILRNPNYHMMFWIWLGLSSALVRTIREGRDAAVTAQGGKGSRPG